jgi:GNAT superfamily N-acetyltransferase
MYPRYADLSPAELARLTEENLYEFLAALADRGGGQVERTTSVTRYSDPAIISPMFNGVVRAELPSERANEIIDETLGWLAERGRRLAFWWVGPAARPADLGERLIARGLLAFEVDAPSMAVDLHALPASAPAPGGFSIEVVRDAATAQVWADTFNAIYGTPQFAGQAWADSFARLGYDRAPYRLYLGRQDGRPVATNMLACAAGAASVLGVGTLPEARGRGIGAAITLRPYLDAREQGYHTGVLFATELGVPVYRRLGFREVGAISRYLWQAA